jgi:hypothetical protein
MIKDRDHALRLLAEGELRGDFEWAPFCGADYKNDLVTRIAKQWKIDAGISTSAADVREQPSIRWSEECLGKNGHARNDL